MLISVICLVNSTRHHHSTECAFVINKYECKRLEKSLYQKINLPENACIVHNCKDCIRGLKTYLLTEDFQLVNPTKFILKSANISSDMSTQFECKFSNGTECSCSDDCTGDDEYCKLYVCKGKTPCTCKIIHKGSELIHIMDDLIIKNPMQLTLEICLFDKKNKPVTHTLHRKLLSNEKASFSDKNLTIHFEDPDIHLPDLGKVIVRTEDYQQIYDVPSNLIITLPYEYLAYKTTLDIIYLHPSGKTLNGQIHINGKTICQSRSCYLCVDFYKHLKCYNTTIIYIFYIIIAIFITLLLICLKIVLKSIIYVFHVLFYMFYSLFKLFKLIARFSLLLGAYLGTLLQNLSVNMYNFLEMQGGNGARIPLHQIVLLSLILQIRATDYHCNTQAVIQSELKTCKSSNDGAQICQLFSTTEITLPTINSETCILFTDKTNKHLFTLKVKLEAVHCAFSTKRKYFTFPVTINHVSQTSCIFNEYCGQGVHCHKETLSKQGLNFEAESPESRQYAGISGCFPGFATGCYFFRASCNFFRTWLVPDLLYSYEVSDITGYVCKYQLGLTHVENNTISRVSISDSTYTDSGIKVTLLGAFDQPQLYITDSFVQRVGRPFESYLVQTSKQNLPQAGEIGAVQANVSYTKTFIFDPNLSRCDFFEDTLRCVDVTDPIQNLRTSKEFALPMEKNFHLFHIKDGKLYSSLLASSAIRVQLHFQNYRIQVKTTTVCPKFSDKQIDITGCYNCPTLARITFMARSTCESGTVLVSFEELSVYTKSVHLETESTNHIIKFVADKQCYREKFCLKAETIVQCTQLDFCMEEPSVELINLYSNSTVQKSSQTFSTWWQGINFLSMGSSLVFLKVIGSTLFIICVLISLLSTIITCCCKTK